MSTRVADPVSLEPFDVVSVGRIGVDVYPQQIGVGLEDVDTFGKYLGGSAANVAVATARLGHRAALISRTGDDPFGRYLRRELRGFGVDDTWVTTVDDLLTVVTFCEIFPPDDFPLYFYRLPKAPDLCIEPAEMPTHVVRDARVYWSTLTGLALEPSRSAHIAGWQARGRTSSTIIDLDYRPMFWPDPAQATQAAHIALEHCTIAIGNRKECEIAVGETEPKRAAAALLDRGVELAIVKQGPAGVLAATREESCVVPAVAVNTVNGLGAGDAFGGAICHGLLAGLDLRDLITVANAAGALVATKVECSPAMPTRAQLRDFLHEQSIPAPALL